MTLVCYMLALVRYFGNWLNAKKRPLRGSSSTFRNSRVRTEYLSIEIFGRCGSFLVDIEFLDWPWKTWLIPRLCTTKSEFCIRSEFNPYICTSSTSLWSVFKTFEILLCFDTDLFYWSGDVLFFVIFMSDIKLFSCSMDSWSIVLYASFLEYSISSCFFMASLTAFYVLCWRKSYCLLISLRGLRLLTISPYFFSNWSFRS